MDKKTFKIDGEYIRLDSLLKAVGLVGTGGQAKMAVLDGQVKVNGEVCLMRTKKMKTGDTAEYLGTEISVI